ncbi:MAG: hypothetical protein QOE81_1994 [Verrucomicrobiota bacterium]|jgi:hypothetical protein
MKLSYVQKLLLAADPFSAARTNFRVWRTKHKAKGGTPKLRSVSHQRHLTVEQRKDISTELQYSTIGPVSMTAAASDSEAVGYEGEIANVLEDTGFPVEIDNANRKPSAQQVPAGVEMTVKEETVRPVHAYRIVRAFRRAGLTIATRINRKRRKNNTLYITVGPDDAPGLVPLITGTAAKWRLKVRRTLLKKWKRKFASGGLGPGQAD